MGFADVRDARARRQPQNFEGLLSAHGAGRARSLLLGAARCAVLRAPPRMNAIKIGFQHRNAFAVTVVQLLEQLQKIADGEIGQAAVLELPRLDAAIDSAGIVVEADTEITGLDT